MKTHFNKPTNTLIGYISEWHKNKIESHYNNAMNGYCYAPYYDKKSNCIICKGDIASGISDLHVELQNRGECKVLLTHNELYIYEEK